MRRILPAFALSATLVLGGCQNPDGSVDWGSTLLVGAGVGAAAALVAGAVSSSGHQRPRHYASGYGGGYRGAPYGGYGGGRWGGAGYRGW